MIHSISRRNNIKFSGLNPGKRHTITQCKFTRKIIIIIGLSLCKCKGHFAYKPAFTFILAKRVFTCPYARVSNEKSSGFWDLQLTQDNAMKSLMQEVSALQTQPSSPVKMLQFCPCLRTFLHNTIIMQHYLQTIFSLYLVSINICLFVAGEA